MLKIFSTIRGLFARDDRRTTRSSGNRRRLFVQQLEDRRVLASEHAFFIGGHVESTSVDPGAFVVAARETIVGYPEAMLTTVSYTADGPIRAAYVQLDVFRQDGTWGQDGIYETPFRRGVTIEGDELTIEFSPYGRGFPQGLFYEVTVQASDDAVAGETIGLSNPHAEITAYLGPTWTPTPVDVHYLGQTRPVHTVSETQTVADLGIFLSGPQTAQAGSNVSYVISVVNQGPYESEGVVVSLPVSPGMTFDTSSSEGPWTLQGNNLIANVGDIPAGQVNILIANFALGQVGDSVDMQARVVSYTTDPFADNNVSEIVTTTVFDPTNVVSFSLSGPSQTVTPDQNDVSLAFLSVNTTQGSVVADNAFIAIQGIDASGNPYPDLALAFEDVELRNVRSGNVVDLLSVAAYSGTEIYRIHDILVDSGDSFEIRVDMIDGVQAGSRFRVHLIAESSGTDNPVNIPGIGLTTDYRTQLVDVDTGMSAETNPGGLLSGNYHTVKVAELYVTEKSIGTTDVVVENQPSVTGARFETLALGDDILTTIVTVTAAQGNLVNATLYSLMVDTDNNGTVDTVLDEAFAQGGRVRFDEIFGGGYVTEENSVTLYEVRLKMASAFTTSTLQLQLESVEAEELDDGSSLASNQITISHTDSIVLQCVEQGSLFVTQDSTPVRSRQLLGGTLGDTVLRLQLRAESEEVEVTDLFLSIPGNVRSIDRLQLYREGETTPFATATIGSVGSDPVPAGYTTFAARMQSRQLVIPEGQEIDVLVRPRMKSDDQGAVSGEQITLSVLASFNSVRARGGMSTNDLRPNDGDNVVEGEVFIGTNVAAPNLGIVGPAHTTVLSKITDVTNANPDANGTSVPSGVSPFAQFRFTAGANLNDLNGTNKVSLETLTIIVDATNVLVNAEGFRFYNKADASTKLTTVVTTLDGAVLTGDITGRFLVRVTGLSASAVDAVLDPGESSTFSLEADIRNPQVNGTLNSLLRGTLDLRRDFFSWYDRDTERTLHNGVDLSDELIRSTLYQS